MKHNEINKGKPAWKVLVVDNEPLVCDTIRTLLQIDGHIVQTTTNGREALSLLERERFDLVTTDYSMAKREGISLPAAIKQLLPSQPVLMISTNGVIAKDSGEPLPGVDMVIGKPFTQNELREAIAKIFRGI